MANATPLIYNSWYVALDSASLKRGKMLTKKLLGQQILLARSNDGQVFALRDFCPHRGMPLSFGQFDGEEIECCYHGWCFNRQGQCTKIPALTPDDTTDVTRIKTKTYPCREQHGLIWIYVMAQGAGIPDILPEILPVPVALNFTLIEKIDFLCNIDHAVIGLMDPSHGPFVHTSWWWRTKRSMHVKTKKFAPWRDGFKMVSHKPSTNSRAYKILGGERTTEIAFQLPALRTEHIKIGNKHILLLTALTPTDEQNTELQQYFATDMTWGKILLPLIRILGKAFIKQDYDVVRKQQIGLTGDHPSLLLLGDADQQALWYFKLKKDFLNAQTENKPFENRIPEKTLSWRS